MDNVQKSDSGLVINPFRAALEGNLDDLKKWFETPGASINIRDESHSYSPLIYTASSRGRLEIVKWVILNGADINATQDKGSTALHAAAYHGYFEVCECLVQQPEINFEVKNTHGHRPLEDAQGRRNTQIASLIESKMSGLTSNEKIVQETEHVPQEINPNEHVEKHVSLQNSSKTVFNPLTTYNLISPVASHVGSDNFSTVPSNNGVFYLAGGPLIRKIEEEIGKLDLFYSIGKITAETAKEGFENLLVQLYSSHHVMETRSKIEKMESYLKEKIQYYSDPLANKVSQLNITVPPSFLQTPETPQTKSNSEIPQTPQQTNPRFLLIQQQLNSGILQPISGIPQTQQQQSISGIIQTQQQQPISGILQTQQQKTNSGISQSPQQTISGIPQTLNSGIPFFPQQTISVTPRIPQQTISGVSQIPQQTSGISQIPQQIQGHRTCVSQIPTNQPGITISNSNSQTSQPTIGIVPLNQNSSFLQTQNFGVLSTQNYGTNNLSTHNYGTNFTTAQFPGINQSNNLTTTPGIPYPQNSTPRINPNNLSTGQPFSNIPIPWITPNNSINLTNSGILLPTSQNLGISLTTQPNIQNISQGNDKQH